MSDLEIAIKEENNDNNNTDTIVMNDDDNDSDDDIDEPPTFGPAALGLHRVGTALPPPKKSKQSTQPIQVLNARGMPARIRKKNKLFFDDELINDHRALGGTSGNNNSSPRKNMKTATATTSSPTTRSKTAAAVSSSASTITPTKILKKRKGVVSKYMKSSSKAVGADNDDGNSTRNSIKTRSPSTTNNLTSTPNKPSTSISATSVKLVIPADKKIGQQIGLRLRNLLKLPKAHKWVSFEWFYSYIDKPLFDEMNDFQLCLKESFPNLKTFFLTKKEWTKIRSMFGKPRRLSQAFFNEERHELERRRQKIRYLQTRKSADINFAKDLPNEIPLQLPIGTKVTARLRSPQDGLFSGTVDAVDSLTNTYRIKFDRVGLGTHTIPDYEIIALDFNETISISSLITDFRPRLGLNGNSLLISSSAAALSSPLIKARNALNKSDPLLGQDLYNNQFKNPVISARETIGGYPVKLLELIVRTKKALSLKQSKLERLKEMNNEVEMHKSSSFGDNDDENDNYDDGEDNDNKDDQDDDESNVNEDDDDGDVKMKKSKIKKSTKYLTDDFKRRYAGIVLSLEKINRDLYNYLTQLYTLSFELTHETHLQAMLMPSYLREKCHEKAELMVHRNNHSNINDDKIINLIINLTRIMLVASYLTPLSSNKNNYILKILDGCIEEVKQNLHPDNIEVFQKCVQIHLHHIQLGLGQMVTKFNTPSTEIDIGSNIGSKKKRNIKKHNNDDNDDEDDDDDEII